MISVRRRDDDACVNTPICTLSAVHVVGTTQYVVNINIHFPYPCSSGNGVDRSKLGYEAPEYSAIRTSTVEYETPLVTSPPFTSSPGSTPPPPPHVYDYAAVPPHIDPEYAPLEGVTTRSASNELPAHVTYHTLEGPVNTVTYHTLEPPKSPENGYELEGQTREIGAEEGGANGDRHEYATLENNIYH